MNGECKTNERRIRQTTQDATKHGAKPGGSRARRGHSHPGVVVGGVAAVTCYRESISWLYIIYWIAIRPWLDARIRGAYH